MIHPNYDFHRQISLFVGRSTPTPSSLHGGVPLVCSLHLPWISKAWLGVAINFTWKVSPNLGGYRMLITQHECNFYKSLVFLVKLLDRKYLFNSLFNWWLDIISNLKFCQLKKKNQKSSIGTLYFSIYPTVLSIQAHSGSHSKKRREGCIKLGSGYVICTHDLQVMSLMSYYFSNPHMKICCSD